jgi:hypothetical protein
VNKRLKLQKQLLALTVAMSVIPACKAGCVAAPGAGAWEAGAWKDVCLFLGQAQFSVGSGSVDASAETSVTAHPAQTVDVPVTLNLSLPRLGLPREDAVQVGVAATPQAAQATHSAGSSRASDTAVPFGVVRGEQWSMKLRGVQRLNLTLKNTANGVLGLEIDARKNITSDTVRLTQRWNF